LDAGLQYTKSALEEELTTRFQDRLAAVIKDAFGLQEMVSEEMTSGDIGVTYIAPGGAFNPSTMVDIFEENVKEGEMVLGTVNVGLVLEQKGQSDIVMVRPKVLVQAGVNMLMGYD
jgi:hypothetical protein